MPSVSSRPASGRCRSWAFPRAASSALEVRWRRFSRKPKRSRAICLSSAPADGGSPRPRGRPGDRRRPASARWGRPVLIVRSTKRRRGGESPSCARRRSGEARLEVPGRGGNANLRLRTRVVGGERGSEAAFRPGLRARVTARAHGRSRREAQSIQKVPSVAEPRGTERSPVMKTMKTLRVSLSPVSAPCCCRSAPRAPRPRS